MKNESRADYAKVKVSALQELAARGDKAAVRELGRRGVEVVSPSDVTKANYLALRRLVLAWRDGATMTEQAESLNLAQRAQEELAVRWRTRSRLGWRKEDADTFGPEDLDALPMAPWMIPPAPRSVSWKRPTGSTHYPSPESIARAKLGQAARTYYNAAGVPQQK